MTPCLVQILLRISIFSNLSDDRIESIDDVLANAETATIDGLTGLLLSTGADSSLFFVSLVEEDLTSLTFTFSNDSQHESTTQGIVAGPDGGTQNSDFLEGTAAAELFLGLGGNDTLISGGGDDTLEGGAGVDFIRGNTFGGFASYSSSPEGVRVSFSINQEGRFVSRTIAEGGDAEGDLLQNIRKLIGSQHNDTLQGESVSGDAGDDFLIGVGRDATVMGGSGDDTLTSDARSVTFEGGSGADVYTASRTTQFTVISDFDVLEDVLDLSEFASTAEELRSILDSAFNDGQGGLRFLFDDGISITLQGLTTEDLSDITFIPAQVVAQPDPDPDPTPEPEEPEGNQVEQGGNASEMIETGSGDDRLLGFAGDDTLIGNEGNDFISGGTGNDLASGGAGDDEIFAGPGDGGSDLFVGGLGDDVIGGGAGNDTIVGGVSNVVGLQEIADPSIAAGNDTLFGGAGDDVLVVGGFNDENQDGFFQNGEQITTATTNNAAFGGAGRDTIYGAAGADAVGGGEGSDFIDAGAGDDTIFGGRETVEALLFNDTLRGGAGDDVIFAGADRDLVIGGDGADRLFGGAGIDTIDGGSGDDSLFGGAGDDLLTGGEGADTFFFGGLHRSDEITDFDVNEDILFLANTLNDLSLVQNVRNFVFESIQSNGVDPDIHGVSIDTGGGDIFIVGLTVQDFVDGNVNLVLS